MQPNESQSLPDTEFINEGYSRNPFPVWLWLFLLTVIILLISGTLTWYQESFVKQKKKVPFLTVTNREFSIFLWENPSFMRGNSSMKLSYLPAFQYQNKISVDPQKAEDYVIAPPEILFYYHVWNRLLGQEYFSRPIPIVEFKEFLNYAEEWHPKFWKGAPANYVSLINELNESNIEDLNTLSIEILPFEVRKAFQGWKNVMKEGQSIGALQPTYDQLNIFLQEHPNFSRHHWKNVVQTDVPDYLKDLDEGSLNSMPLNKMSYFLRTAFYNYMKAN